MNDALNDTDWIIAMQDELNQFARKDVWSLIPKSNHMNLISTK